MHNCQSSKEIELLKPFFGLFLLDEYCIVNLMDAILGVLKVFSLGYPGVGKRSMLSQITDMIIFFCQTFSQNSQKIADTAFLKRYCYFQCTSTVQNQDMIYLQLLGKKHVESGSFSVIVMSRTFNCGNLQGLFHGSLVQFVSFDSVWLRK